MKLLAFRIVLLTVDGTTAGLRVVTAVAAFKDCVCMLESSDSFQRRVRVIRGTKPAELLCHVEGETAATLSGGNGHD